ncbi:ABC transporter permease [Actinocrinis sp.]|uniref:ABC transporter permease n=1 Tax=Actinocrinis sp. TaxID=1920516 RepID=UPI002CA00252|nr:ABC transporter permease [Actinocrinis sp.]HXR71046.1 ABC transporter permease [Actinocrinis sp.]
MTTASAPIPTTPASRGAALPALLRSEWIKLRAQRSTFIAAAAALILGLGVGLLDVLSVTGHWATMSAADRAGFDPVGDPLSGFQFGELALGALGVLAVSTEYATGMIRTTLTAAPRRTVLYTAKALALGVFALLVSELCAFSAFLLGQLVLRREHLNVPVTDAHVLRAVTCAGLYAAVVAMVGFGLGALLRHTAAAICAMFALVFLAYPLARTFEGASYLPDHLLLINAASALATVHPPAGPHAARVPSFGFALFDLALYLAVFLGFGAWRATRDA